MSGRLIGDSLHLTQTFVVPWGWFLYNITSDPSLKRHHQAAEVPQSYFFFTICFDYKRSTTTSLYTQQHPHGKSLKTGRLPQAYRACLRSSDPFLNRFFFFFHGLFSNSVLTAGSENDEIFTVFLCFACLGLRPSFCLLEIMSIIQPPTENLKSTNDIICIALL